MRPFSPSLVTAHARKQAAQDTQGVRTYVAAGLPAAGGQLGAPDAAQLRGAGLRACRALAAGVGGREREEREEREEGGGEAHRGRRVCLG
jgi:hypothetical protein